MKKQTYTNKLNELVMNYNELKDEFVKSDLNGTVYGNQSRCYIQVSYNTVENDNYYYITVNDYLSDYSYTLTYKNGEMVIAQRTYYKYGYKEVTESITINTYDKHFRNALKEIERVLKSKKHSIELDKMLNGNNKTVAEKAAADNNTVTMECNDTLTADNFDYQSAHKIEQLADKLDINDCIEYINDILTEYEIGYGCYTFDQLKAIYKYTLNKQDIKEFCLKLQTCYSEYDLNKELITDNLCMFNLELLTCEDVYIYDSAEEYLQYFLENYGEGAQEFYDNIIYYLLDAEKIVEYIEQSEYYPFYWTDDGQLIQVCY